MEVALQPHTWTPKTMISWLFHFWFCFFGILYADNYSCVTTFELDLWTLTDTLVQCVSAEYNYTGGVETGSEFCPGRSDIVSEQLFSWLSRVRQHNVQAAAVKLNPTGSTVLSAWSCPNLNPQTIPKHVKWKLISEHCALAASTRQMFYLWTLINLECLV